MINSSEIGYAQRARHKLLAPRRVLNVKKIDPNDLVDGPVEAAGVDEFAQDPDQDHSMGDDHQGHDAEGSLDNPEIPEACSQKSGQSHKADSQSGGLLRAENNREGQRQTLYLSGSPRPKPISFFSLDPFKTLTYTFFPGPGEKGSMKSIFLRGFLNGL